MRAFLLCVWLEFKKNMVKQNGWILILCTMILQIAIVLNAHHNSNNFDTNLYRQYTIMFRGVYSEETKQAIINEKESVDQFMSGQLAIADSEKDMDLVNQMILANEQSNVLRALINKYQSLGNCRKWNPVLSYDIELSEYIEAYHFNWAAMLFIIVWTPLLILGDYNCGMDQILFPSSMGQTRLMCAKICIGCLVGIIITLAMTAIQWGLFTLRWDFGELDIPIQSLSGFEASHVQWSIALCLFIGSVLRLFAVIALVFLLCILSAWIRKEAITITIATSIII